MGFTAKVDTRSALAKREGWPMYLSQQGEEKKMSFKVTYCPVCGAEHSDIEKMSEREAVQTCLDIDAIQDNDIRLTSEDRAKHVDALDEVHQ